MPRIIADHTIRVTQSNEVWQLMRRGRTIAFIERAWDDLHWLLFLVDAHGDLHLSGTYRHTAALKAHVRLWARASSP